jgi:hypothetical protein
VADSYSAGDLAGSGDSKKTSSDDSEERARVKREFVFRFKQAKKHWADWRTEARDLYDFIAGRQWDDEDAAQLREEMRPVVTFNVAGKYMDAVTGLQINNRQDIRYFPRENGDAKVNELMTGAVSWCRDQSNMIDEETDAFYDSVLTGLGWMEGYLDKDLEPDGIAAGRRVDNMEMLPDPSARQRNLEDAKYVIRERLVDHEEYREIFGEYADDYTDDGIAVEELGNEIDEDTGIQIIPSPHDYGDTEGSGSGERLSKGKCPVQDYQFWRRELRYVIAHPAMGSQELTKSEYEAQKGNLDKLLEAGEQVQVKKITKKVFYRAWFSKGKMGPYGESPYQGGFTYHAITGKRDRNKQCWYGLGRAMTDAQRWTNKFFSTILYCLMVGAKGGIMAEEDSFKDARKAESEWANPNAITWMKRGALSGVNGAKVQPKPKAEYPEGLDRLMEFTMNALPQTSGLNMEILGLADRVQAGVIEAQRKQSAMAIIAWAFDAMRRYYRSMGRQMARYVIDYMPEGIIVKINGKDQAQYVPLVKDALGATFDVIVDEAPTSTNMRERVWAVIETLVPQLLQAGLTVPKEVLDYSPLPPDLAQKWKEALNPPPEAEMQKQLTMAGLKADVDVKTAKAAKDQADARKTLAEINAPEANGQSDAMVKANADVSIAKMKAEIDAHLEELKANKKAETEILIAKLKLDSEREIANLKMQIDLALGEKQIAAQERAGIRDNAVALKTNAEGIESKERQAKEANKVALTSAKMGNQTKEKIAKSKPKPAAKKTAK